MSDFLYRMEEKGEEGTNSTDIILLRRYKRPRSSASLYILPCGSGETAENNAGEKCFINRYWPIASMLMFNLGPKFQQGTFRRGEERTELSLATEIGPGAHC